MESVHEGSRGGGGGVVKVEQRTSTHPCVTSTGFMSYLSVVLQRREGWPMKNSDGSFGLFLDSAACRPPGRGRPCPFEGPVSPGPALGPALPVS